MWTCLHDTLERTSTRDSQTNRSGSCPPAAGSWLLLLPVLTAPLTSLTGGGVQLGWVIDYGLGRRERKNERKEAYDDCQWQYGPYLAFLRVKESTY